MVCFYMDIMSASSTSSSLIREMLWREMNEIVTKDILLHMNMVSNPGELLQIY